MILYCKNYHIYMISFFSHYCQSHQAGLLYPPHCRGQDGKSFFKGRVSWESYWISGWGADPAESWARSGSDYLCENKIGGKNIWRTRGMSRDFLPPINCLHNPCNPSGSHKHKLCSKSKRIKKTYCHFSLTWRCNGVLRVGTALSQAERYPVQRWVTTV